MLLLLLSNSGGAPPSQTLSPARLDNAQTFYGPTVTTGAVALAPSLLTNAEAFYAATVTPGAVNLGAARFDNAQTFYAHTLTQAGGGAQTLLPSLFTNAEAFYAASISQTFPGQTLSPGLFVNRANGSPFTKTLLNLNGTNGSTTITDGSPAPHTFTAQGSAALSTAQSKFGGASLSLNGASSWVQTTTGLDDYRFGTGDFVVEAQVYPTALSPSGRVAVDFYASSGNGWQVFITSAGKVQWWRSSLMIAESTASLSLNTWAHILVSRSSGTTRVFINGALEGSASDSTNYTGTSINTMAVGAQVHARNSSYDFSGYIDDVRIQSGTGVSSAFTAPTNELENPFFGAALGVGPVALLPGLFTNAQTFYGHTLTGGVAIIRQKGLRKTRYTPGRVPAQQAELMRFLQSELERLTDALESPFTHQLLEVLNVEPVRKRDGMVAMADGTNWAPDGLGQGVFVYYGGSWKRLG